MKRLHTTWVAAALALALAACGAQSGGVPQGDGPAVPTVEIRLSDGGITVDGAPAAEEGQAVRISHDIVYYEDGKDFTYGEGTAADAHSTAEAAAHTVVHITEPGAYRLSGTLSRGQIAVDLGEGAEEDPTAVVTLILNDADITCEVAPAIIFYRVYECGSADTKTATREVDTSAAGANILIADGTENTVTGSYVARIYKPGTVVLNKDGTEVEDAKKLHKYDGAVYSKMSMNVDGGPAGTGVLTIRAENEGLDTELHLTVNGGILRIFSGNDGINTNEDGVSVTTVNGGEVHIRVTGETGEGDGIDSNGWLVINGGTVTAQACAVSADAGIDSDMGIHINGGTVIAAGSMLDRIEDGGQTYAVFNFAGKQKGEMLTLRNEQGGTVMEFCPENGCSVLIFSSPDLTAGTYTLHSGDTLLAGQSGGMTGPGMGMAGMRPDGGGIPQRPEGGKWPEGMTPPEGAEPPAGMERPDGGKWPEGMMPPNGTERPEGGKWPEGGRGDRPGQNGGMTGERSAEFHITDGGNLFGGVAPAEPAS